ncbi:TIGR00725 family protein [Ornithinimicrobium pratense]|uniref:TIGR00725 family protein n=1 Tax=Ornithinimicrobium pratense TaxID=2593973 RepID=UPI001EE23C3E|nr:TIGR00725 family protein [Ornithinimicrobium pratense]
MRTQGYVGVVGPGAAAPEQVEQAVEVGRLLAGHGLIVVTGGLGGVMAGAAAGCAQAGGLSLGLLPGTDRGAANPHLSLTVPTGMGEMRNALLVRSCDAMVAVGSSWGTVSEIALAARTGVPVVLLDGLRLFDQVPGAGDEVREPVHATTPAEAVAEVVRLLGVGGADEARSSQGEAAEKGRPGAGSGTAGQDAVVLGVDRQAGSWVGVVLPVTGRGDAHLVSGADLSTLVERARSQAPVALVAVDIPVGLPDTGIRQADVLVRQRLSHRGSSVFPTPVREALAADTYAKAREVSVARTGGRSLSAQSYALRSAILDVDAYVRGTDRRAEEQEADGVGAGSRGRPAVVEAHPELSFAVMAGAPLHTRKKTPEGIGERVGLLTAQGIRLPPDLTGGRRGVDDVLDAAAAAWTAARVVAGRAERIPAKPERFSDGLDAAMWV